MNASELAAAMLQWEQKRQELDTLEEQIKTAVLELGKTYVVGNVRATFSQGRKTYDYQLAANECAGLRLGFSVVCEENSTRKVDWKAVCDYYDLTDIPFEKGAPSVTLKIT
jgi:hypothetical protein